MPINRSLPLEAIVSMIHTRPYSEQETENLSPYEQNLVRAAGEEKVLDEVRLETVIADSVVELRVKIMTIMEKVHPTPIIVKTEAFPDSFLVGKQYYHADPRGIFESIAFNLNPDHPTAIAVRKRQEMQKLKPVESTLKKEEKIMSEAEMKAREEKTIQECHESTARAFGLGSYPDFIKFMKDSIEEGLSPSRDNFQEAISKAGEKFKQRYYEHGGRGAYTRLENPKQVLNNTTILFRVIGRDSPRRVNHMRYYLRLHDIRASATSNDISD